MRRQLAIAALGLGGLLVHACALGHYGIDASLDEPEPNAQGGAPDSAGGMPSSTAAGAGAGGEGSPPVATGDPCPDDGARACVGAAQQERLVCQAGSWTATDSCVEQENCDQASGECLPILEPCVGSASGKRFCADLELSECGPDLVSATVIDTCADQCIETGDTAECVPAGCGDKVKKAPEQCDDGNEDDTDDCTSACKAARCGDTVIWTDHEACDDGNSTTETCAYGQEECTVCNASCQHQLGAAAYCGDGKFQGAEEQCDPLAAASVHQCTAACELTTWALWPLAYASPPMGTYSYTADFVTDETTGLTWERNTSATDYTWEEAKAYCAALDLRQISDWRLPTRVELMSIVDYGRAAPGPTITTSMFPGTMPVSYWTSLETLGDSAKAWEVDFRDGTIWMSDKTVKEKVRCVY